MEINAKHFSFGRNETFFLRYGWIAKGLAAYKENSKIFSQTDAPLKLGVGKNMVSSMKFWLSAYDIIDQQGQISEFGNFVFDQESGLDPFSEDEITLWLLHWKLCINPHQGALYYWFFNEFKKTNFTLSQFEKALDEWLVNYGKKVSENTLKRDRALLLRTYLSKNTENSHPEDFLDNSFNALSLINLSRDERTYNSPTKLREGISPDLIGFCLSELKEKEGFSRIPVNDLIEQKNAISFTGIFKIDKDTFIVLLEELSIKYPEFLNFEDGIDGKSLIFSSSKDPFSFLRPNET